jgi:hypothetical protein
MFGSKGIVVSAILAASVLPALAPAAPFESERRSSATAQGAGAQALPTGEFLVDTNIIGIPISLEAEAPATADDGANYFVAWASHYGGVYGARVSHSGRLLDPGSISMLGGTSPSVAFGAGEFFVVWQDASVRGARISQSGVLLDSNGFQIASDSGSAPAVAFDGTNFLVIYGGNDLMGVLVSPSGQVLTQPIAVSTAPNRQENPALGFDGTDYLVVWQDLRGGDFFDIYGARVTPSGAVLEPDGIPISTALNSQVFPALAFDGTDYLVVWQDYRTGDFFIYGTMMNTGGQVLDTTGFAIATTAIYQRYPAVAFGGDVFLVSWERFDFNSFSLCAARVDRSGTLLDTVALVVADSGVGSSAVVFGGTNYLVAWQGQGYYSQISGTLVTLAGGVLNPSVLISAMTDGQWRPAAAYDGANYLVVWQDGNQDSPGASRADIYGLRLDASGRVLDSLEIPVAVGSYSESSPAVAAGDSDWLVAWEDHRSGSAAVFAARVNSAGRVLDTAGIPIGTLESSQWVQLAVAFGGTNYLVVWEKNGIHGARVTQSGQVLDSAGFWVSDSMLGCYFPAVAFDGANYFVVWTRFASHGPIQGARVTPGGVVLDSPSVFVASASGRPYCPAIAFDGNNYLVVWTCDSSISGVRVSPSGVVLDTAGITYVSRAAARRPTELASDGSSYFLVYERLQSGRDLFGVRVSPQGVKEDSFPVETQTGDQMWPALARGPGSQLLLAYSGWTEGYQGTVYKAMRIWGKFSPLNGVLEEHRQVGLDRPALEVCPNPFHDRVTIRFPKAVDGFPSNVHIYDACGRLVRSFGATCSRSPSLAGALTWDGTDNLGRRLAPGVYVLRVARENRAVTCRLVLD